VCHVCAARQRRSSWLAKPVRSSAAARAHGSCAFTSAGMPRSIKKRKYLNKTIHGGLRDAQAHLNKMLGERDRGRSLDSSKQTLNQYLHRWLAVCAKARLQDYEGLPAPLPCR
jgi:uncharacterized protein YqiB (DUF1249 family)